MTRNSVTGLDNVLSLDDLLPAASARGAPGYLRSSCAA